MHLAATEQGADAAALLDSRDLMQRVAALGPDTSGYLGRVTEAVREAVQTNAAYRLAGEQPQPQPPTNGQETPTQPQEQAPGAPRTYNDLLAYRASGRALLTRDYAGEITAQDVQDADPRVVGEWATTGRLAHLDIAAQKRRGRR